MNPFLKFVLIVLIVSLVIFAIGIGLIEWFVSIRRDQTEVRSYGGGSYYTQLGNGFDMPTHSTAQISQTESATREMPAASAVVSLIAPLRINPETAVFLSALQDRSILPANPSRAAHPSSRPLRIVIPV